MLDESTPAKHDMIDPDDPRVQEILAGPDVVLTQPSNTTKFNIIALLGAVVPLLLAVASQPNATAGQWAQGIAGALGAGAVYLGAYNRVWWKSPKMYALGFAAVLTAAAPLVTNAAVGVGFHLTGQQISVVVLTSVGAFIATIVPATQGQDQVAVKAQLQAHADLYAKD